MRYGRRSRNDQSVFASNLEVGKIYRNCEVKKILEFGCFVEIFPGVDGLCHISELEVGRVATVNDVVKEGEKIDVKLLEINGRDK